METSRRLRKPPAKQIETAEKTLSLEVALGSSLISAKSQAVLDSLDAVASRLHSV
jgi:hypothetical protein